ncbi:MAG: fumarate hydratase [Desulfobacterota bacterium]|nr:fumarate hydratase [Thermodesulfobacteriota bacterium]MDW8001334.1 fumarate hydratase [Deltaproteobacteria bacterium]
MREVDVSLITETLENLFIEANLKLSSEHILALRDAIMNEESEIGKEVIESLLKNAEIAEIEGIPICQDTGLACVFLEIGQDVHLVGGNLEDAINEGVRRAYKKGYLRSSTCDPITRKNTGDNTPAIIHEKIVPGDRIRILVLPKGGGSENYSEARVLTPAQGAEGIKAFVLEMVRKGGPNPCPPLIVGIGIGGNLEMAALLAKEALFVPYKVRNPDNYLAKLEIEILNEINKLGIGPQGYGGRVTALDVHIKAMPCHIASLPVAVAIQCHAHRVRERII